MVTVKSEKEIELMREPCKIVRDVLEYLGDKVKPGVTTAELDRLAYKYITSYGAKPSFLGYHGYPASVCVSIDEQVVHGIPSDRIIKEGEIVSLDVGAYLNGYHGDAARTFPCGKISAEKQRLIDVTRECFFKGIEGLASGTALYSIGARIQEHAEANGYSVVRALVGHGIGKQMHEDPSVPNFGKAGTGMRLKSGMTIAIEPMINAGVYEVDFLSDGWTVVTRDKKPSAHYENTVLIGDFGAEILTL